MDFYCDQVLTGHVPVERIHETDRVLAFYHTAPYWAVHVVIVPKLHIDSLATLGQDDREREVVQEMLAVAADICRQVTVTNGGCRLSTNCGDHQSTKHLHFYIHSGLRLRHEDGTPVSDGRPVATG